MLQIAKIDGVDFGPIVRGKRSLPLMKIREEEETGRWNHCIVFKGDFVKKGQQLTEGPILPHDILDILDQRSCRRARMSSEVYRLQGVTINDKHIK